MGILRNIIQKIKPIITEAPTFSEEDYPEIIYISVNNWFKGRDYPSTGFFPNNYDIKCDGWSNLFTEEYCKENRLCVNFTGYDMSENLCISAPKKWVIENCPELLKDENYRKRFIYSGPGADRLGCTILEYTGENIGVKWSEFPEYEDDDDDNE